MWIMRGASELMMARRSIAAVDAQRDGEGLDGGEVELKAHRLSFFFRLPPCSHRHVEKGQIEKSVSGVGPWTRTMTWTWTKSQGGGEVLRKPVECASRQDELLNLVACSAEAKTAASSSCDAIQRRRGQER